MGTLKIKNNRKSREYWSFMEVISFTVKRWPRWKRGISLLESNVDHYAVCKKEKCEIPWCRQEHIYAKNKQPDFWVLVRTPARGPQKKFRLFTYGKKGDLTVFTRKEYAEVFMRKEKLSEMEYLVKGFEWDDIVNFYSKKYDFAVFDVLVTKSRFRDRREPVRFAP